MNHVRRATILAIVFIITCWKSFGQNDRPYMPPSPDAAALIRQASIQVGHYTGVAGIGIPLANLPGKDITVPVSVHYNASGIKVSDVGGSVGLGWNLNAGGAITRMVRGLPDGFGYYCNFDNPEYFRPNATAGCDGERDIFYFSALGRTGKMFLDDNGTPRTMPYQDLKIEAGVGSASIGYWKITDENGYAYFFGETSTSQEQSTYHRMDQVTGTYGAQETYISTWYLSKIVSPTGETAATFSYLAGSDVTYTVFGNSAVGTVIRSANINVKILQAKYIDQISTSISSVKFEYLARNDFNLTGAKMLNTISVKDNAGVLTRKFYLDHDYFKCDAISAINCRLRLSKIREGNITPIVSHQFSYHEAYFTDVGGAVLTVNPPRNHVYVDHFGFCNSLYPYSFGNEGLLPNEPAGYPGNSKNPHVAETVQVLTLKEIINSSGSKTAFEYESNGNPGVSVGLRIKSISTFQNESSVQPVNKVLYTYTGVQGYRRPVYHYTASNDKVVRSSNAYNLIYDINGAAIGYSTVTETFLDGSKIIRGFTNFADYPDNPPAVKVYNGSPFSPFYVSTENANSIPFPDYSSNAWMRGLPTFVEIRDAQNNTLQKEEMNYLPGSVISSVGNNPVHLYDLTVVPGNAFWIFYVGSYYLRSQPVYLDNKKSYVYDQTDFTKSILETTAYQYHSTLKTFPTSITSQVGTGPQQKVTLRYPVDVAGTGSAPASPGIPAGGIWALRDQHVITPVEELVYFKDYGSPSFRIVDGTLYSFSKHSTSGKPLLSNVYELEIGSSITALTTEATLTSSGTVFSYDNTRYRLLETYVYNDATSKVERIDDYQGISTNYGWGYNNSLVTSLGTSSGGTQFQNQYTYNTINGLTSARDANNQFASYTYDSFGRLRLVKDSDNNIIHRFRINLKNEKEYLTASLAISGSLQIGSPTTFTVTSGALNYGTNTYYWDFGDGTSATTLTTTTTKTYSLPGTYPVTVTVTNSEYGSASAMERAVIH